MIERRRIWTDALLADYIRDELGFPGARQGAMVEKESVDIATGEVSRERWYLLTSLGSRQWGPRVSRASTKHTSGAEQKCTTREVIGQRKCPRQLFGRSVAEAGWQQAG